MKIIVKTACRKVDLHHGEDGICGSDVVEHWDGAEAFGVEGEEDVENVLYRDDTDCECSSVSSV